MPIMPIMTVALEQPGPRSLIECESRDARHHGRA
jgi:hypothetical protein